MFLCFVFWFSCILRLSLSIVIFQHIINLVDCNMTLICMVCDIRWFVILALHLFDDISCVLFIWWYFFFLRDFFLTIHRPFILEDGGIGWMEKNIYAYFLCLYSIMHK